ncbi:aminotransferase DegT [Desulfosporosinus sp. Tol-M]|jgi:Predicted pyridoxal phosphate-dependent enzyme apparently involved in regulation of cell wall biogenesis|nr:aminotransferase DegT [Desulfosporosinus sp. Tol-M]
MKKEFDPKTIIQTLQGVLPREQKSIALHEPLFKGNEWNYVKKCLDSGWVSSTGKDVDRFEKQLAEYSGIKHVIAVVNGTAALHICLQLAGVTSGDEVLVPALTFIATTNAVSYCGAVPHFADNEERTLGLDPFKLGDYLREISELRTEGCFNKKSGRRIKAVLPMHTFGHPVDIDPLMEVCQRYKLMLVEDAAESLGSLYKGYHTGCWGRLSALSFNGNKIVTTGGGGAILTNESSLAVLARHLTTQAKLPHAWSFNHDMVGYNYRMPNINAALGCAQLEQLPEFIKQKRSLAVRYQEAFADLKGVKAFKEADFARSNYWLNVLLLDEEYSAARDTILELTNKLGIMTRPAWTLMHQLPMYQYCPRMDLSTAENLERRIINLPSSAFL